MIFNVQQRKIDLCNTQLKNNFVYLNHWNMTDTHFTDKTSRAIEVPYFTPVLTTNLAENAFQDI